MRSPRKPESPGLLQVNVTFFRILERVFNSRGALPPSSGDGPDLAKVAVKLLPHAPTPTNLAASCLETGAALPSRVDRARVSTPKVSPPRDPATIRSSRARIARVRVRRKPQYATRSTLTHGPHTRPRTRAFSSATHSPRSHLAELRAPSRNAPPLHS